ncbi:MAG: Fic family protein [Flavobacteriaceae bacterium]|nr:Fic family protein [Flavobacteriaceae bacterium]
MKYLDEGWKVNTLPVKKDLETKTILKSLPKAHAALAELKGLASTIPNQTILINTLGLQEAKDSSAIENIITTHDDLFKSELNLKSIRSLEAKEVQNYIQALNKGFELIKKNNLLTNNIILQIQEILEKNKAGFRKLPGTALKESITGKTIYTPPQDVETITKLMSNLENYINDSGINDYDPLVKMAIIHFQFESIHPFYDGNGRTGRIINILYLILNNLLELPILYLSNYIIRTKSDYYKLLQEVRTDENWEEWISYMIKGIEETSIDTVRLINRIKESMQKMKITLRENYKFYSQDLLNNLFKHPYTKIEYIMRDLNVGKLTAAKYLNQLAKDGILSKHKIGRNNYYINIDLFEIMTSR